VDVNTWALILIIVPFTLAVLAIALGIASRRGYYWLGALALGTLVLALLGYSAFSQAAQDVVASSADGLQIVAYALFYFVCELGLALALTLCAVVVAATARHWWWLAIIVFVSVVPAALIFASSWTLLSKLIDALGLPRDASGVVFVLPPALVTCAYAIVQSVRHPLAR
jgi:hypothetical protein